MTINTDPYLSNTTDDFMPTPRAYKFIPPSDYFSDSLENMINKNSIWLSRVIDFNDPLEMASFTMDSDIQTSVQIIVSDLFRKFTSEMTIEELLDNYDVLPEFLREPNIARENMREFLTQLNEIKETENDPIQHFIDLAQKSNIDLYNIIAERSENARQYLIDNAFVYCLTDNISNSAMWAYYANNHQGIAIEFYKMSPVSSLARPVSYTDRTPILSVTANNMEYLTTKNVYWQHESERRFIEITINNRVSDIGNFVPDTNYFKFTDDSLIKSNGKLVKSIFIGLNTKSAEKKYGL